MTDNIICDVILSTNNWYVVNFLSLAIEKDFRNFINNLSDVYKYLIPNGMVPLKTFFDKSNFWSLFVGQLSSYSEITKEYGKIFNIIEHIKFTEERCLDILDINC